MPDFTQWNVPTPFTNVLFNPMAVDKAANDAETARQQIGSTNMEMVGRAAGSLLGMSETDAANAYPGMVANLQRNGFAMNAPSEYPGHAALTSIVNGAIPVAKQYEYGILTAPGVTDALKAASAPLTFGNNGVVTGGGTSPVASGQGGPRASDAVGGDQIANAKAIHDGLVARGMDNETALAMSANLLGESGGNWQTNPGDGGASHGIAQWNKERLAAFQAANGGKLPAQTNLDAQLDFLTKEWKADHNGAATAAGQFGTAEGKIAPIVSKYEVSANQPADIARRSAYLNQLRAAGIGAGGGTAVATAPVNPNAGPLPVPPIPPAVVPPSQATVTIPQSPTATRLNGTDVAGPPGVVPTPSAPAPQPNVILDASGKPLLAPPPAPNKMMAGVGLPGVTIGLPQNGMAPPPPPTQAAAPVVTAAAPAPPPVTQAPAAAPQPRTGQNSPQFQAAMELNRRAQALDMVVDPTGRTKALAASLRAQAALYMQADSVTYDPRTGIGTKAITGEQVSPAKPLPHYVWDSDHNAWVDTNASVAPVTPRAPSLTTTKEGTVIQSEPGGRATVVYRTDPKGVAEQAAAAAEGTATGTATAQALPKMMDQGRSAAQAIGNIDYGMSQLAKAKEGGINTGYFAPWLSGIGSLAKSIGGDTGAQLLGIDPAAVGNIQTARKTLSVVSGAILQQILGPGSAITNDKIEAFIHAQPGIETDPAAVERVLNWARSQFTYEREMSSAAVKEARKPENQGRLPPGWQAGYFDDHGFAPIYDPGTGEMRQPEGSAPGREPLATKTTAAITAPPVNPSERTANTTYTTPKGPLKWTGTGWVAP